MTVKNTLIPILIICVAIAVVTLLGWQLETTAWADGMRTGRSHQHTYGGGGIGNAIGSFMKVFIFAGVGGLITIGIRRLIGMFTQSTKNA